MQKGFIFNCVRFVFTMILFLFALSACSKDEKLTEYMPIETPNESKIEATAMEERMKITIGNATFTATLEDNTTARALVGMMPMTLHMEELNGNEKYHYLPSSLPVNASNPDTIHAGDIMLYDSSCLVVFYKTFSTNYSYTKIGSIENSTNLADAVGNGNVSVTFEMYSSTGIAGTEAITNENEQLYSINGTRVNTNYKGIYIKNGKKYK